MSYQLQLLQSPVYLVQSSTIVRLVYVDRLAKHAAGLWLYTVAMSALFIIWLSITAYKSGQLFRTQFNAGYCHKDFEPVSSPLAFPLCCLLEDRPDIDVPSFSVDDSETMFPVLDVADFTWQELKKLAKAFNIKTKKKVDIQAALSMIDSDELYEAYQDYVVFA